MDLSVKGQCGDQDIMNRLYDETDLVTTIRITRLIWQDI
jgi:hypothetical protein